MMGEKMVDKNETKMVLLLVIFFMSFFYIKQGIDVSYLLIQNLLMSSFINNLNN